MSSITRTLAVSDSDVRAFLKCSVGLEDMNVDVNGMDRGVGNERTFFIGGLAGSEADVGA